MTDQQLGQTKVISKYDGYVEIPNNRLVKAKNRAPIYKTCTLRNMEYMTNDAWLIPVARKVHQDLFNLSSIMVAVGIGLSDMAIKCYEITDAITGAAIWSNEVLFPLVYDGIVFLNSIDRKGNTFNFTISGDQLK